jgi:hypothetical protein
MHVLHPWAPNNIMRNTGLQNKSLLDSKTTRPTFKFMHVSIRIHRTMSVRGGEVSMPAQAKERREAVH